MRFAHFFVERPIFATVLSLVLVIVGLIAYGQLPVAQYPEIAPPSIVVRASYPGADAETVAATVATPLDQEKVGRASCRERGGQYVEIAVVAGYLKKKE